MDLRFVDLSIVSALVQLAKDGKVIRVDPIRHDRSRELGAFRLPPPPGASQESALG